MSTLQVQTLQGPTSGADSNTVRVADGHKLHAKGHVVQVQTFHADALAGDLGTSSTTFVNSGAAVTITPQFSNSLIVCDFVTPMSKIPGGSTGSLNNRLLLNNVEYGGSYTAGYTDIDSGYNPTVFKTVHEGLVAGTPVEFKLQFRSSVSGQIVLLTYRNSSITMTLTEIAQ